MVRNKTPEALKYMDENGALHLHTILYLRVRACIKKTLKTNNQNFAFHFHFILKSPANDTSQFPAYNNVYALTWFFSNNYFFNFFNPVNTSWTLPILSQLIETIDSYF